MTTLSKLAMALAAMLMVLPQSVSAVGAPQNFAVHEAPIAVPDFQFEDGDGKSRMLADFRGRIVLLNIWATWCAPCRKEMPTLDRLQAKLGGPDFEVVALSMDRGGPGVVRKFFAETGVEHLALDIDTTGNTMFTLGAPGLPLTLLIDRKGEEIGRLIGPAEWDSPEMAEFLRNKVGEKQEGNAE